MPRTITGQLIESNNSKEDLKIKINSKGGGIIESASCTPYSLS